VLETDGQDMIDREHSVFFSAAHAAKGQRDRARVGKERKPSLAPVGGFKTPIRPDGRARAGEIDKSGISELTFSLASSFRVVCRKGIELKPTAKQLGITMAFAKSFSKMTGASPSAARHSFWKLN